jgi:hypothetical protein
MEKWNKNTYVCGNCDSLLEITTTHTNLEIYCVCAESDLHLLSVVDATISPNLEKEEQIMETATPTFMEEQIRILQDTLKNHTNCDYWKSENGRVQSQIIDVIDEIYAGNWADEKDIANTLSQIIDYSPTKEISFTATMSFTGTIQVPASEADDFDLTSVLEDAYVDINHGDVVIDSYELYDAEEC